VFTGKAGVPITAVPGLPEKSQPVPKPRVVPLFVVEKHTVNRATTYRITRRWSEAYRGMTASVVSSVKFSATACAITSGGDQGAVKRILMNRRQRKYRRDVLSPKEKRRQSERVEGEVTTMTSQYVTTLRKAGPAEWRLSRTQKEAPAFPWRAMRCSCRAESPSEITRQELFDIDGIVPPGREMYTTSHRTESDLAAVRGRWHKLSDGFPVPGDEHGLAGLDRSEQFGEPGFSVRDRYVHGTDKYSQNKWTAQDDECQGAARSYCQAWAAVLGGAEVVAGTSGPEKFRYGPPRITDFTRKGCPSRQSCRVLPRLLHPPPC